MSTSTATPIPTSPLLFLYDSAASPFAQVVRIVLREKGLEFTSQTPADIMRASPTGPFALANPKAEVPTLIHDSLNLSESSLITEYLNDAYPSPPLHPASPAARAAARLTAEVCRNQYEAVNWTILEMRAFTRAEGERAAKIEKNAKGATEELQGWLAERLGEGLYFSGEEFGIADIFAAVVVKRSVFYGLGPKEGSVLQKWLGRVEERESVRKTFEEGHAGLKAMIGMGGMFKVEGQERKREYRDHRLDFIVRAGGVDVVLEGMRDNNIRFSWPHVKE